MEHTYRILKPGNQKYKTLCEKFITPERKGYVEIDNGVCVLSEEYLKYCQQYEEFEVRNTDVFVITYPRSGTTWTQEMVWMIANNVDFEGGKKYLHLRVPFLEYTSYTNALVKKLDPDYLDPVEMLDNTSGPRFIKSHLPWSLLPLQIQNNQKQPKIIYVIRNPKDTCVSNYYLHKSLGYTGSFEELAEMFLTGRKMHGSYWTHVLSYWEQSNRKNLLIITYEEMKSDLPSVIGKVAKFLEKNLTLEQITLLAKHLSFESIRENNAVNPDKLLKAFRKKLNAQEPSVSFIRSGKMGNYYTDMSPDIAAKFDEMTKKIFKGIDFPYLDTMLL